MGMTLARRTDGSTDGSHDAAEAAEPEQTKWSFLERAWIWSVVGYTVLRFVVAWGAFSSHGANVWIFGLLDVGTAWPYAKAVAVICRRAAASEWRRLGLPLAVALVSFFAPYGYLWFAAGEMPAGLRAGFVICVVVLATAATLGIASQTRKLRAAARDAATEPEVTDVTSAPTDGASAANRDVVIDLTTEPATVILQQDGLSDASVAATNAHG